MINPNLTLKEKALRAAYLLRDHALHMAASNHRIIRIGAEPRMIAADAIEQLIEENEELRAQLAKYQSPDYQSLDDLAVALSGKFPTPPFYDGERVRLKKRREITGIVERVSITWLTGKPTVVCVVNTSLSPSLMTFAASDLESLPEADNPKQ
ncbi:hypothetical protein U9T76_001885 [Salmonella enterica]|nr:hypothetical protein [Salmonella enterica]EMC3108672.1 hypothetical protein [Salmonella enterica]EMD7786515.1 hypothetical protein [Salmonella enterica]